MATGRKPDVIVVGAGVFGLCAAYFCARSGMQVTVLEKDRVGAGASGGIVGAMAPHTPDEWNPKKQFQFEALDSAEGFWREVDALSELPSGYGRIGRLVPILDARTRALAEARHQSAKDVWQGRYTWNILESHSLTSSDKSLILDDFSARIYPEKACASLAFALQKMGVAIEENWPVATVDDDGVSGPKGTRSADQIILAAGLGGFDLLEEGSGSGVKGQAALLDVDLGKVPQLHSEGLYVVPHISGKVAIGSTSEVNWDDAQSTDMQLDQLLERARTEVPALKNARVLARWAGVRPKAKRRSPMLGAVPGKPNLIAALGGYKIGFGIAHKSGQIVADIAGGKDAELPRSFTVDWHLEKR